MASIRYEKDRGRKGWRLQTRINKRLRSLWLGDISKRAANTVGRHVDELVRANAKNVPPDADSVKWAMTTEGRIRDTLTKWGIVAAVNPRTLTDGGRLLGPFTEDCINSRVDVSEATRTRYRNTRRFLLLYFKASKPLVTITTNDCERFRRWLVGNQALGPSTVAKHIQRCRTMFHELVRDKILTENPFSGVKATSKVNRERDYFVTPVIARDVLAACHTHDWRVIFGLARFGGFRPCEILTLKWTDILWDVGKIRCDSPKTGLRHVPLWPALRSILWAAHEDAPDGSIRCVQKYGTGANLGTQLHRIIELAGHEVWPKTFVNMRASRRTELERHFPHHVVNSWMGHGSKTANAHYLQVTDDDWTAAGGFKDNIGGDAGGDICANPQTSPNIITSDLHAGDTCRSQVTSVQVPRKGVELSEVVPLSRTGESLKLEIQQGGTECLGRS